jgi:hypothetical protein
MQPRNYYYKIIVLPRTSALLSRDKTWETKGKYRKMPHHNAEYTNHLRLFTENGFYC